MKYIPSIIATLYAVDAIYALPGNRRIPDVLLERLKEEGSGFEVSSGTDIVDETTWDDVEEDYFEQVVDHFNDSDDSTFQQRYFYSSRFVQGGRPTDDAADATVSFLCVGGEGPSLDGSVLTNSLHCTGDMIALARELHDQHDLDVHLFALEHRYYGNSFPSDGLAGDLTHLSSRQAVQDVASFVQHVKPSKLPATWITFGGSYPGMLSAWSRLLHPSLIHGAVSSSAPLQPLLDFVGYNDRVGLDLQDSVVGGSHACHDLIVEGHKQVVAVLRQDTPNDTPNNFPETHTVDHVANLFNVCGGAQSLLSDRKNMEAFVGDGLIRIPAQGNDPSCQHDMCNIQKLCKAILDDRDAHPNQSSMETLARISQHQMNGECLNVDYSSFVNFISDPSPNNDRSWYYQTCTEFGFYQSCNLSSKCPYGQGYHDVQQDLDICQQVFGIHADDVREAVQSTLEYYGGWDLIPGAAETPHDSIRGGKQDGKRILFVNGDVDPWTEQAVTSEHGTKDYPVVSVHGASHHFWTHEEKTSDGQEIFNARRIIHDTVMEWLGIDVTLSMGLEKESVLEVQ